MRAPQGPWMYLVRLQPGRKPQVFRLDPHDLRQAHDKGQESRLVRRRPCAWAMVARPTQALRSQGVAAVGNSVDEAWRLAESLAQQRAETGVVDE